MPYVLRNIAYLQKRQCRKLVDKRFREVTSEKHGIDAAGIYHDNSDVIMRHTCMCSNEVTSGEYATRTVDLSLEAESAVQCGQLFQSDNFVFGQSGAGTNWFQEHYTKRVSVLTGFAKRLRSVLVVRYL